MFSVSNRHELQNTCLLDISIEPSGGQNIGVDLNEADECTGPGVDNIKHWGQTQTQGRCPCAH